MKKLIALVLCVVVLCSVPAFAVAPTETTESEEVTLGIDETGFQLLFTTAMEQQKQSCTCEVVNRVEGKKYDYLTVALSEYCTGVFTIKNSEIVDILIVCSRDGTKESDAAIVCAIMATMASVDPGVTVSSALDVFLELAAKFACSTENCAYELTVSDTADMIFTVKPLETAE